MMHLCARSSAQVGAPVLQGRRPTFLASLGTQARMLGVQIRLHSEVVQYWDSDDEPAVVLVSGEVVKGDVRPPSLRSRPLGARTLPDAFSALRAGRHRRRRRALDGSWAPRLDCAPDLGAEAYGLLDPPRRHDERGHRCRSSLRSCVSLSRSPSLAFA